MDPDEPDHHQWTHTGEEFNKQDQQNWLQFKKHPGREFVFRIGRDIHKQGRDRVFSEGAFEAMYRSIMLFIGSRLTRYADEHNGGFPAAMSIRIRVAMDWDAEDFNMDDLPFIEEGGDDADPTGV